MGVVVVVVMVMVMLMMMMMMMMMMMTMMTPVTIVLMPTDTAALGLYCLRAIGDLASSADERNRASLGTSPEDD
jgi:hypothetical protein